MTLQALVDAAEGRSIDDQAILRSCVGLLLFGVPNKGLNDENFLSLLKDNKNQSFVLGLEQESEQLRSLHTAFLSSCEKGLKKCIVISFFETKDTKTLEVSNSTQGGNTNLTSKQEAPGKKWKRIGRPIRLVTRESATGFMPQEEAHNQIPIDTDHLKLVKFANHADKDYLVVRLKVIDMVRESYEILCCRGMCIV